MPCTGIPHHRHVTRSERTEDGIWGASKSEYIDPPLSPRVLPVSCAECDQSTQVVTANLEYRDSYKNDIFLTFYLVDQQLRVTGFPLFSSAVV